MKTFLTIYQWSSIILYFLVAIAISFVTDSWLLSLLIIFVVDFIQFMLPISVIPFSIIGLIVTINGTQDWFSTLYYVVFGIDAVVFILAAIGDIQSILHFRKFK